MSSVPQKQIFLLKSITCKNTWQPLDCLMVSVPLANEDQDGSTQCTIWLVQSTDFCCWFAHPLVETPPSWYTTIYSYKDLSTRFCMTWLKTYD